MSVRPCDDDSRCAELKDGYRSGLCNEPAAVKVAIGLGYPVGLCRKHAAELSERLTAATIPAAAPGRDDDGG